MGQIASHVGEVQENLQSSPFQVFLESLEKRLQAVILTNIRLPCITVVIIIVNRSCGLLVTVPEEHFFLACCVLLTDFLQQVEPFRAEGVGFTDGGFGVCGGGLMVELK